MIFNIRKQRSRMATLMLHLYIVPGRGGTSHHNDQLAIMTGASSLPLALALALDSAALAIALALVRAL